MMKIPKYAALKKKTVKMINAFLLFSFFCTNAQVEIDTEKMLELSKRSHLKRFKQVCHYFLFPFSLIIVFLIFRSFLIHNF